MWAVDYVDHLVTILLIINSLIDMEKQKIIGMGVLVVLVAVIVGGAWKMSSSFSELVAKLDKVEAAALVAAGAQIKAAPPSISNITIEGLVNNFWIKGETKTIRWTGQTLPTDQTLKLKVGLYTDLNKGIWGNSVFVPIPPANTNFYCLTGEMNTLLKAMIGPEWYNKDYYIRVRVVKADGTDYFYNRRRVETRSTQTFKVVESVPPTTNSELAIMAGDSIINSPRIIDVHATNKTTDVELASINLKAKGDSDLVIEKFGVNLNVAGALNVDDVLYGGAAPAIWLEINGERYGVVSYFDDPDGVDVGASENVLFDDIDYNIGAGETLTVNIVADILPLSADLDSGDKINVLLKENVTDLPLLFSVKNSAGQVLTDAQITGAMAAGAHTFQDVGPVVSFVSSDAVILDDGAGGSDDDIGTFTLVFDVNAFGGSIYLSDTAVSTTLQKVGNSATKDGIIYRVYDSGTATADDLADLVTFTTPSGVTDSTNNILIQKGATSRITLTVTQTNNSAEDDGIYYMELAGIAWGEGDDEFYENMYSSNLGSFKTRKISLD